MIDFFMAYEAFERKLMRGEMLPPVASASLRIAFLEFILEGCGDVLIRAGMHLKQHHSATKRMNLSSPLGRAS